MQTRLSHFTWLGNPFGDDSAGRRLGGFSLLWARDGLCEPDPGEGWPHPGGDVKEAAQGITTLASEFV